MTGAILFIGLLIGCARTIESPAKPPARTPASRWQELLIRASSSDGVDYSLIARHQGVLERYIAWISVHGPQSDEMRESAEDRALSFLINAHNAAVIYGVLHNKLEDSTSSLRFGLFQWPGGGFFHGQLFRIDSEWVSLAVLARQNIIARYQEPLLHMALNYARRDDPPLKWWPASRLQNKLEAALRQWLSHSSVLQPVDDGWSIHPLFIEHEQDFVYWSQASSLCDWLTPYTRGNVARWLETHAEDCNLSSRPMNESLNSLP